MPLLCSVLWCVNVFNTMIHHSINASLRSIHHIVSPINISCITRPLSISPLPQLFAAKWYCIYTLKRWMNVQNFVLQFQAIFEKFAKNSTWLLFLSHSVVFTRPHDFKQRVSIFPTFSVAKWGYCSQSFVKFCWLLLVEHVMITAVC